MTKTQADNLATLIDLLENEVEDEEYDQRTDVEIPCCANGHAWRRWELFHERSWARVPDFPDRVREEVLCKARLGHKVKGRPARLEAIRRLRKILDDDGWEIA